MAPFSRAARFAAVLAVATAALAAAATPSARAAAEIRLTEFTPWLIRNAGPE
jgi:hypothetical protein